MSQLRPGTPGATRDCPHCQESILESATVCPACRHHIRFEASSADAVSAKMTPLRIEGSFRQPPEGGPCEYSVVVSIRNERGVEIARKLIGVGALSADEQRSFTLLVEMSPCKGKGKDKGSVRH